MRSRVGPAALALALAGAPALAIPIAAPGFTVAVVEKPGAVFAGLAQDGDALLVTNLADGRLYRWTAAASFAAFGPAFPHGLDVMGDPTGPYRVAPLGANYLVAQGWTAVDADEGPMDHALLEVDATNVLRKIAADFWNPFDFVAVGDILFVVDSARNTIERLDTGGAKQTLFAFPRLEQKGVAMKKLSPTEFPAQKPYEVDAVPTGIADHDGRLYVSLFGGFPYIEGGGVVVSLDETGPNAGARLEVDGLDTPVDVAFDGEQHLLVLEHGRFDQASGFIEGSGRLVRIDQATGARATLLRGLTRPTSILVLDGAHLVVAELAGALVFLNAAGAD